MASEIWSVLDVITIIYQANKYFSDGKVIDESLHIINDIKGFKKNEIKIKISPNNTNGYK